MFVSFLIALNKLHHKSKIYHIYEKVYDRIFLLKWDDLWK